MLLDAQVLTNDGSLPMSNAPLLVLLRHGQSEWNLKNLFTGWKDPDLTPAGRRRGEGGGPAAEGARASPSTSASPPR